LPLSVRGETAMGLIRAVMALAAKVREEVAAGKAVNQATEEALEQERANARESMNATRACRPHTPPVRPLGRRVGTALESLIKTFVCHLGQVFMRRDLPCRTTC
jgi:hypothetical protein